MPSKVDVVVTVGEAAEVGLALAQPDAVGAGAEGAGNDLDDLAVVGDGRGEVLDVGIGDQRLRGTLFNESAAGRRLRRNGIDAGVDGDLLRIRVDTQPENQLLRLPCGNRDIGLGQFGEAGGGRFHRVAAGKQSVHCIVAAGIGAGGLAG
jgi:hypothetical protein